MIESQAARPDAALLEEVRDGIALRFGDAIAAAVPAVVEVLEQQLMQSPERTQWKALKGAISMLRDGGRGIGQNARTSLASRFDAKLKPGADSLGQTARFSLESLSLVADEEMRVFLRHDVAGVLAADEEAVGHAQGWVVRARCA